MTLREKVICEVYTGICFVTGDDRRAVYEYASELMGRPVFTHEFALLADQLKELSKDDFIAICRGDEAVDDAAQGCEDAAPLDWVGAKQYLDTLIGMYQDIGSAGQFGLVLTLWPLRARYESGERTKELYDEIMECE